MGKRAGFGYWDTLLRNLANLVMQTFIEAPVCAPKLDATEHTGGGPAPAIRGVTVHNVAYNLGYDSVSAFITMFRKLLGQSPARYMNETRRAG